MDNPAGTEWQATIVTEQTTHDGSTTRVMLVDDHDAVRVGLRALLEPCGDIELVAEAATADEAVVRARSYRPDVVVLDMRLPDRSGIEACRDIRAEHPDIAVLMLTSFSDDQAQVDSILAGAAGYVLKRIRGMDLVDRIRRVARGDSLLDPAATAVVHDRLRHPSTAGDAWLTPTELRIAQMMAEGMTDRVISEQSGLTEKTIKRYGLSILAKMHMSRRSEAASHAEERPGEDPASNRNR